MSEHLVPVGVGAALLAYAGLVLVHSYRRSKAMVERWAAENGFTLLRREWHGSVAWIWTVRVVDGGGRTRDAWVSCGNPMIGLIAERADVRWAGEGRSAFR